MTRWAKVDVDRYVGQGAPTRFGILGPLSVADGARELAVTAGRGRIVLAMLLLQAGRVVSIDMHLVEEPEPKPVPAARPDARVRRHARRRRPRRRP